MSDLLSLLSLGSSAISAQNVGAGIAGNNVANANTKGFSRQRVDLRSLVAAPLLGGVRADGADRFEDRLLASRTRVAAGALAMSQSYSSALGTFETTFTSGSTIDEQLAGFYGSVAQASSTPTDPDARAAVVSKAQTLALGINRRAAEVSDARVESDQRVRDNAARATSIAAQLAGANNTVAKTGDPVARDHRDQLANQLAGLTGGAARIDPDGNMRFVLDGGAVLVDGVHAASLVATGPAGGLAKLEVVDGTARRDVTDAIGGGAIGADLQLRDRVFAGLADQLDKLAFDVASRVNTIHAANAAKDGTTGHVMFAPLAGVAGAASALAVDPALVADSNNLALAAPGAGPGDNTGARALFALASTPGASGLTLGDESLAIVSGLAREGGAAKDSFERDSLVSEHLDDLRDSLAGVDPQEELADLARFEHASSALAKFVSTIDDMLGSLINQL